jgi:hypothetical protein
MQDVTALAHPLVGRLMNFGSTGNGRCLSPNRARDVDALLRPWLLGRLWPPFSVRWSCCVDIDFAPRDVTVGAA